ncbi:MAG TPA: DUF2153 domain-containing protein [Desulfurococcales archaeon]|nr:DUF2153 domain-containing protein [Desulfurococcales archaeon]
MYGLEEGFYGHLTEWVKMQKKILETIEKVREELKDADRLSLIIATRTAFQHIMRTIKAFDQWLQDPFVINHMPREMILEVQERVWKILKDILELDIKHTSEFRDYISKLAKEGKLSPLLWAKPERAPRRPTLSTTM